MPNPKKLNRTRKGKDPGKGKMKMFQHIKVGHQTQPDKHQRALETFQIEGDTLAERARTGKRSVRKFLLVEKHPIAKRMAQKKTWNREK